MIFEKECKIKLNREKGGWTKFVTGIDESQRGGYSLLGNFVKSDKDLDLKDGLYVDCDKKEDYKKNVFRLFELQDGEFILLSEIIGNKWTTEFHKIIREKQGLTIAEGMEQIKKIITQFTAEDQLKLKSELFKEVSKMGLMFQELEFIEDGLKEYEEKNKGQKLDEQTAIAAIGEIVYFDFEKKLENIGKPKLITKPIYVNEKFNIPSYRFHSLNSYGEYLINTSEEDGEFIVTVGKII